MRAQLLAGLRALLVLTIACGLVYPLAVTATAQLAFSDKADGSLVRRDGMVIGSEHLGQAFADEEYFHSRPSAAGPAAAGAFVAVADEEGGTDDLTSADPDDLSVAASGASNLGPTNEAFLQLIGERVEAYRDQNGLAPDAPVPVDAVTSSGSGLDPHISVANARLQAPRVARARRLSLPDVLSLVKRHTDGRSLGFLGEEGVHVLRLNLAIDDLDAARGGE